MDPNQVATLSPDAIKAITPVWHYMGAALGFGITVLGAGLGIGKLAAAAAEGVARQPSAAGQITAAANLPLFLLEGATILALVFGLLVIFLR
jgi:F-type H+-transporting ATPase subunit c